MARFVVSIDQGTTGTTVLVFDESLSLRARGYREFAQHFPQPGWVEHDPEQIWESVIGALTDALHVSGSGVEASQVVAIGITNQRETTLVWERATGKPLHRAIVWQDRRTADECARLKAQGREAEVKQATGLVLDPYFSGTKIKWLLDNVPGLRGRAEKGEVCFGTVDSFLVWRLTGGSAHVTDVSNASRTLLFDLQELDWSDRLCDLFTVPRAILPSVRSSAEVYGETRGVNGLRDGIPVAGMAGDQQAALFGQACFNIGDVKCTYGTGAFMLMNTGARAVPSQNGLVTTVGWKLRDEVVYALEGSTFIAGAMVQWLRDGLGIIGSAREVEALAASVPDSHGVVVVPALAGLGAPHWRPDARGIITGLTRGTNKGHIARAVLEGIALQIGDLLHAMRTDAGVPVKTMKVDGGAAANDLLMQFQSDVLGIEVVRPALVETTALGAAMLAGISAGIWKDTRDAARSWKEERRFKPQMPQSDVDAHKQRWQRALERA